MFYFLLPKSLVGNVLTIDINKIYKNPKLIKKILNNYNMLLSSASQEGNMDVFDILIDIQAVLDYIDISQTQRKRIQYYMNGYSETDLGRIFNVSRQSIQDSLNAVCKKISKELGGTDSNVPSSI